MSIDNKQIIKVTNRDNGRVGYQIPDLYINRIFEPYETKDLTAEEIRKLSYVSGGRVLLKDYLVIDNEELIKEILHSVEPEYFYTEQDIKDLLVNGSLDALKDCLDYAPMGTIDLLKKLAVELPLNDVAKRKAILDMTGFNVDTAIMIEEETKEPTEENNKVRRLDDKKDVATTAPTGRRTTVPKDKYKIIEE